MFYHNNAALVALFIFTVISFHNLSHAQLNSLTVGSTADLCGNCHQTTPDHVYLSVANPMFSPTSTNPFTECITEICGNVKTEYVLIADNLAITPTFTTVNPLCRRCFIEFTNHNK